MHLPDPPSGAAALAQQLPLFPGAPGSRAELTPGSLARHFARFLQVQPRWLERGAGGLPALTIAFLFYLNGRLRGRLSSGEARRATDYARGRAVALLARAGELRLQDLPPWLAASLRRQELRSLVHEALGRHLKRLRQELAAVPAGEDPVPAGLLRYGEELRLALDALLDVPPAGAASG